MKEKMNIVKLMKNDEIKETADFKAGYNMGFKRGYEVASEDAFAAGYEEGRFDEYDAWNNHFFTVFGDKTLERLKKGKD